MLILFPFILGGGGGDVGLLFQFILFSSLSRGGGGEKGEESASAYPGCRELLWRTQLEKKKRKGGKKGRATQPVRRSHRVSSLNPVRPAEAGGREGGREGGDDARCFDTFIVNAAKKGRGERPRPSFAVPRRSDRGGGEGEAA